MPFNTRRYWNRRYQRGSGSSFEPHEGVINFETGLINEFIKKHEIKSVLDMGCGDGSVFQRLRNLPIYHGMDISSIIIARMQQKYEKDDSRMFFEPHTMPDYYYDLVISIDTIYHLVNDHEYIDYLEKLEKKCKNYLIISSTNYNAYYGGGYIRHRAFLKDIKDLGFKLLKKVDSPFDTDQCGYFVFEKLKKPIISDEQDPYLVWEEKESKKKPKRRRDKSKAVPNRTPVIQPHMRQEAPVNPKNNSRTRDIIEFK